MPSAMPYSPAAQAKALYASTGAAVNLCLSSCTLEPGSIYGSRTVSQGALGSISEARPGNYGGLNPSMGFGPYYDPRTVATKAPIAAAKDGGLITAPSLAHGPSAFFPDVGPVKPKTQYAPHGKIQLDPVRLSVFKGPCICGCAYPYSMASLLVAPENAVHVRNLLEKTGIIKVSKSLKALTPRCACQALGGPEAYNGLALYAQQFEDTSIAQIPDPMAQLLFLDQVYVDKILGDIRSEVVSHARMNYLRAEGPRAYLQSRPKPEDEYDEPGTCLPEILPGTGIRTTPEDTRFAARNLTDPRSSLKNRMALSCQTGLNIGSKPAEIEPTQSECPSARCGPVSESIARVHKPFVL